MHSDCMMIDYRLVITNQSALFQSWANLFMILTPAADLNNFLSRVINLL